VKVVNMIFVKGVKLTSLETYKHLIGRSNEIGRISYHKTHMCFHITKYDMGRNHHNIICL